MPKNKSKIDLSIIIVSFNTLDYTKDCVESILKSTKKLNFEIIIIDNNSKDGSLEYLSKLSKQYKNVELVKSSENIGFGPANNLGFKKSNGKYILFINSDTIIKDNLINEMKDWMDKHPKYGLASCALKNSDNSYQGNGGYFPNLINVFTWMSIKDFPFVNKIIKPFHPKMSFYKKEHDLDWVTGAYMMIRREAFSEVLGFDEDYFMYTEDVDLCFRIKRAGWKIKYLPKWKINHFGGASSSSEFRIISEFDGVKMFFSKHYPAWQMPILRFFLKLGSFLRIFFFGKTYLKAFLKV